MTARVEARFAVKQLFRERGIRYPAAQIFMRIFKRERQLELWVRPTVTEQFALLKTYPICALAGELGPKRRQGDEQVPEGFYYIDHFNPQSDYLLSLHLDYPNRADALLGNAGDLGGDIFIHGGCNSAGCLALTDQAIKEVYWLSVEARGAGQTRIPVHIFPARLTDTEMPRLGQAFAGKPQLLGFWRSLKPGFEYFERERRVPRMNVGSNGSYQLAGEDRFDGPAPLGTPLSGRQPLGTPAKVGTSSSAGTAPITAGLTSPASLPPGGAAATTGGAVPLGTRVSDASPALPGLALPQPLRTTGKPVAPVKPLGGA
jgi:murein L,D-transpeptidase YafK